MNAKTVGALAVVLAASAVIAVKVARQRPAEAAVTARAPSPSVVLIVDPREADRDCGCGQIIRRVREAKARGVSVQEIGPSDPGAARWAVTITPTVLILGADEHVVARREGESTDALAAVSADLTALEGKKR